MIDHLPPIARRVSTSLEVEDWALAEEVPVEIGFNGQAWCVMMATPQDLEDLAIGLALTEGAILSAAAIRSIETKSWPEGMTVDMSVDPTSLQRNHIRRRTLDGRTGCGLCGVESLADLHAPTALQTPAARLPDSAFAAAFEALPAHQPLNRTTHSVHAAAWCDGHGKILAVREDVGRHNALDKLVGACLREESLDPDGFVVMSSRCSYELVIKAARLGARALATISAPTGFSLDLSLALNLDLVTLGPGRRLVRFTETQNGR